MTNNNPITGTLVILRHGQTEFNNQHLMTGVRDVPLTSKGEDQARDAGLVLSSMHFDTVFSSTLSRAFNTAALALDASGSNTHLKTPDGSWRIEQSPDIIERDVGDFCGRNHRTDPDIIEYTKANTFSLPMPGGESEKQVVERVQKFFDTQILPRLNRGENVLVVCHAGVVRAFDYVLGIDPLPANDEKSARKHVFNADPTAYLYEDGKLAASGTPGKPLAKRPPGMTL
jgi:2,3-bisphosphoglycerate-dependent phosphoglycerate mutase